MGVDGIILSAISVTEEHHKIIESTNIPVIIIAQEDETVPCIANDDYRAGKFMGNTSEKTGIKI